LATRNEVTFVSLTDEENKGIEKDLGNLREVHAFSLKREKKILRAIKSLFSGQSYRVSKFWNRELQERLEFLLERSEFDILWINFANMAYYIPEKKLGSPILILDEHNVDEIVWRRFADRSPLPIRFFSIVNARRELRWRRQISKNVDIWLSVSEEDAEAVRKSLNVREVWVVPNGVDTSYFQRKRDPEGNIILFCGSLNIRMNEDAVRVFATKIFPKVRRRFSESEFWIVGSSPSQAVRELERRGNIKVFSDVDDVRPFYEKASVFVAPFSFGGGTKIKILEALSMEIPVVTTTRGVYGLDVEDNVHLLIEDDLEKFAGRVISILESPKEYEKIVSNGRRLAEEKYDWKKIVNSLEKKINLYREKISTGF